jgi:hypothetical protein
MFAIEKNTLFEVLNGQTYRLSLLWFFIGYWILKTGLDVYPGPIFFAPGRARCWNLALGQGQKKSSMTGWGPSNKVSLLVGC